MSLDSGGCGGGSICRHFLQGKCSYGDTCRFPHEQGGDNTALIPLVALLQSQPLWAHASTTPIENSGDICRHFLQGKCTYGTECRFPHGVDNASINETAYVDDTLGELDVPAAADERRSKVARRDIDGDNTQSGICRHFLMGQCTYGVACRFPHAGEGGAEVPSTAATQSNAIDVGRANFAAALEVPKAPPLTESTSLGGTSIEICRHYILGKCTYGDACRFSHDAEIVVPNIVDGPSSSPHISFPTRFAAALGDARLPAFPSITDGVNAGTGSNICRHYLQGRCERGDLCRFSHDAVVDVPRIDDRQPPSPQRLFPTQFVATLGGVRPPELPAVTAGLNSGTSNNICRHYLQGRCERGDLCRFSHDAGVEVPNIDDRTPPSPQKLFPTRPVATLGGASLPAFPAIADGLNSGTSNSICRHYLQGRCEYGDTCRFSHGNVYPTGAQGVSHSPSWAGVQALGSALVGCLNQAPRADVANGDICRHFLEGKCTYGAECRFSHGSAPVPHLVLPPVQVQPALPVFNRGNANPVFTQVGDDRNVCRHFMMGKCDYGDDCGFVHPGIVSKPVCSHFLQGRCTYGKECKFRHPMKLLQKMATISIHGIPPSVDETDIIEYFNVFGSVTQVDLKQNTDGTSKGRCSVEFVDIETVAAFLQASDVHSLGEAQVEVRRYEIPDGQVAAITADYASFRKGEPRRPGPYSL